MRPKRLGGFFTVETSLLSLIVIPILLCLLYGMFFLYDRCRLEEELCVLCFEAAEQKGDSNAEEEISRSGLTAAYVGCRGLSAAAREEKGGITAEATAQTGPGEALSGMLPVSSSLFQVHTRVRAEKQDAPLLLWKAARITDQARKLTNTDSGENS